MVKYISGCLSGMFTLAILFAILSRDEVKPMDVYKGKTTLKYEVVDGIKVDSTVVWKDDFKK